MKFTQISTLALAAMMAFSSCSKEEVMNPGEADLLPGEARIVLDLGRKGATTYSTKEAETAIKNGGVKLFYKSGENAGKEIVMTSATVSTDGKVVATVPAGAAATKADVTMYVYLNAASVVDGAGTPADKSAKSLHATGTVATVIDRDLSKGAPAGLSTDFTLAPGTIKVDGKAAKRAIARVGATNMSKETSIAGFKIGFNGVNLTKGAIYDGSVTDGALVALEYPLAKSGLDKDSATTSENETVAYMYPSKEVTVTITPTVGLPQDVKFTPEANMNYTIKITPKKPATDTGNIEFTVSIEGKWDEGGDMNVDFNGIAVNSGSFPENSGLTLSGENVITAVSGAVGSSTEYVDCVNFLGADVEITGIEYVESPKTYSDISGAFEPTESADKRMKSDFDGKTAKFALMPNNTGKTLEYTLKISYKKGTISAVLPVKFTQPAIEYPENFSVQIGAHEWMTINSQNTGNLADDAAIVDEINKLPGDKFHDKIIAYAATNFIKVAGNFSRASIEGASGEALNCKLPTCPVGYALPASQLLRNEFFGISGTWIGSSESMFGATEVAIGTPFTGATSTGKTISNTLNFNMLTADRSGYMTITDPTGNIAVAFWRGQMAKNGNMVNPHIGGYTTSTMNAAGNSTERTLIGVQTTTAFAVIQATTSANNVTNSSMVRCVKQTPDMYWGK